MKKIILGAVVTVGVLGCAGAWYTGKVLPDALQASIKQANEEMDKSLPSLGVFGKVELASLQSGVFSSTARYRLQLSVPDENGKLESTELFFTDKLDHGPFPLSRLTRLKLAPVMAESNFELESSEELAQLFAATNGVSPLSGNFAVSYSRAIDGDVRMEKVLATLPDKSEIDFSGMDLHIESSAGAEDVQSSGQMEQLKLAVPLEGGAFLNVAMQGLKFSSDVKRGSGDIYVGNNAATLESLSLTQTDQAPLLIQSIEVDSQSSENAQMMTMRDVYKTGMISFQGQNIGTAEAVLSASNIDMPAVQSLMAFYTELTKQAPSEEPELTPEQEQRMLEIASKLLAAKPVFGLEKLALKTTNGETSASLNVNLDKPESFELDGPELASQLLSKLDLNLSLSRKTIEDVVALQAALAGLDDPQAVAQQAKMSSEMAGVMAMSSGLATVDGDTIRSSLSYADKQVNFNGKQMPLEQFIMLIMGASSGLMGNQP